MKTRKNTLELDVAFFSQTLSAKLALQSINDLKSEIIDLLKKTYTNVDITFKEINDKDRKKLASRDIRDKMTITYSGDKTIKEETADGTNTEQPVEQQEPEAQPEQYYGLFCKISSKKNQTHRWAGELS